MGATSRRKGVRAEQTVVNILKAAGLDARRVPLSGAAEGYPGDVKVMKGGEELTLEVKIGSSVPLTPYRWLGDNHAVVMRRDGCQWLVVMPLASWVEVERG